MAFPALVPPSKVTLIFILVWTTHDEFGYKRVDFLVQYAAAIAIHIHPLLHYAFTTQSLYGIIITLVSVHIAVIALVGCIFTRLRLRFTLTEVYSKIPQCRMIKGWEEKGKRLGQNFYLELL